MRRLLALVLTSVAFACSRPPPPPPTPVVLLGWTPPPLGEGETPGWLDPLLALDGFRVSATDRLSAVSDAGLEEARAVILPATTADELEGRGRAALIRFVQRGGGVLVLADGIRAGADWPWYRRLVAGRADSDPIETRAVAAVRRVDGPNAGNVEQDDVAIPHEAVLPAAIAKRVEVVAESVDSAGTPRPYAWRHRYDGGRVAVVAGSGDALTEDQAYHDLLVDLLTWTAEGARDADHFLPGDDYFEVELLVDGLADPIEIDVASDGSVFILEREGALKRYDPNADRIEVIHRLDVACRSEVEGYATECGGLGLALDPDFATNALLYLYYSPLEPSVNRLSRFRFDGGRLVDERVLFDVGTDREQTTCHEGGSLAFGPDGHLFVSTGDNTNPFESDGYAPIDEREERREFDAQRSAGNSMDLRGSILRITPQADGTYTVPAGNLWPRGTERTRPEIYVKGCRNPYRIAIDPTNGFVYWGDVGPDASRDDELGNTRGFDELNQARGPGYFGWPYFRGGRPYLDRDFEAGEFAASFADRLVNDSPNNEGLAALPPAIDPFLAYDYDDDPALPELGDGGRNAMAGPVCYSSVHAGLPPYFDRVLFFYDWMRAHLFVVDLDEEHRFRTMHRFLGDREFQHPIDLELARDGSLYLLEYGSAWWDNVDGRLIRIRFGGFDRRPRAMIEASASSGGLPLEVAFDGDGSFDPEWEEREGGDDATVGDGLTRRWTFGDGARSTEPNPTHVYRRKGVFDARLEVTDAAGKVGVAEWTVVAGNSAPEVRLSIGERVGGFEWGETIAYDVVVTDAEDGDGDGVVDLVAAGERLRVIAEYVDDTHDGEEVGEDPYLPGMNFRLLGTPLLREHGCAGCHHPTLPSVGPSFTELAVLHRDSDDQEALLERYAKQIVEGGAGRWGHVPMPSHKNLARAAIDNMLDAICDLAYPDEPPLVGEDAVISLPERPLDLRDVHGSYVIRATYSDLGGDLLPSLTATSAPIVLVAPPVVTIVSWQPDQSTWVEGIAARFDGDGAARSEDHVSGFDDVDTALVWTLDVVRAGTYRLSIEQACPDDQAGSRYRVLTGATELTSTVVPTDAWDDFVEQQVGDVRFESSGEHELRLEPLEIADDYVANVKGLRLQRIE